MEVTVPRLVIVVVTAPLLTLLHLAQLTRVINLAVVVEGPPVAVVTVAAVTRAAVILHLTSLLPVVTSNIKYPTPHPTRGQLTQVIFFFIKFLL